VSQPQSLKQTNVPLKVAKTKQIVHQMHREWQFVPQLRRRQQTRCAGGRHNMLPPLVTLTFDLLTLKVVSESRVTWATSVPILVFLGLSVLD